MIVPETLVRYINRGKRRGVTVEKSLIEGKLNEICESLRDETLDFLSQEYIFINRPRNPSDGNRHAREELRRRWTSLDGKLGVVSGKSAVSRISEWVHREYGVNLNAYSLARAMVVREMDAEVTSVMRAIEEGTDFP